MKTRNLRAERSDGAARHRGPGGQIEHAREEQQEDPDEGRGEPKRKIEGSSGS